MISIIIPTRNRPELLDNLLQILDQQLHSSNEIIVVDSSDELLQSPRLLTREGIRYVQTAIKSAAIQRNIGLENASNSEFIFFLDDDVIPSERYFEDCINLLQVDKVVGVSGIAINPNGNPRRIKPFGLKGLFQRIFLLDSMNDGVLLKSGVNIPVRESNNGACEVEWLIGCSAWKNSMIQSTRFESDFMGQSLGEDVIFSIRMNKKGILITDPRIKLCHLESSIERPIKRDFWRMWVVNRARLIVVAEFGLTGKLAFWWANFGQLIVLTYSKVRRKNYVRGSIDGLVQGCYQIIRGRS